MLAIGIPVKGPAQSFTLACMPDPQYYTTKTSYGLYNKQTNWLVANRAAYNIQHVIWLGDLTNDNTAAQWSTARAAYNVLDTAALSYAVVPGNHDYKPTGSSWAGANYRDLTRYNGSVGPSRFSGKSWYGGNMGNTTTNNENNYTYFSGNGMNFLVIGLEYAPRKEVLTWANNLIAAHPNHRVILFTHSYLTTSGNYGGQAGSATGTVGASGAEIYAECASRHNNVFLVACGHVTESVVNTKSAVNRNTLYELLVDYQSEQALNTGGSLGNGWLRLLTFDPTNNRISGSTLTPANGDTTIFTGGTPVFYQSVYNSSPMHNDHRFNLPYDQTNPMEPYSYLVGNASFHATGVAKDLTSDQQSPDVDQDANANWVSVWAEDNDDNGKYNILMRGFDADGNERFTKRTVNTDGVNSVSATNPAIAMMPDGRFVVTWQSGDTAIKVREYSANGTPVGSAEQTVLSTTAPGTLNNPDVAVADNGDYVVTWGDDNDGNGSFQIRARGFSSNYTQRFAAKTVNAVAAGQQQNPAIAMAANGDYVVVWDDDRNGTWDIAMRGFFANETEKVTQADANATTVGEQRSADVAMDDSGRFVVVWEDDYDLNSAYQIFARGFNATGAQRFSERTVNVNSSGNQINPVVAMDANSNWYPVWEDNGISGDGYQVNSNMWTIDGSRVNAGDARVNPVNSVSNNFGPATRKNPAVSAHRSGRYIVAWGDDMDGDLTYQNLVRGMAGTACTLAVKSLYGTVSKSIDQPYYAPGDVVSLTATPQPGRAFFRWSGDVPGGTSSSNPINITVDASKRITAEYIATSSVDSWPLY